MFHHLSAKCPKCCLNFGLQRNNDLKIPDAHPYPRLYRIVPPPPEFLGNFQELVFEKKTRLSTQAHKANLETSQT